ncbi:MAG TPA: uroporphyrinogen-III C-methyltransferase [Thermohalobaculum sp.]|nr:uroporphyrinogen-III C-methyltransferase [Thermohalobaculum sp.]
MNRLGRVFLVGAGPGDPELLTLKAMRLIGQAEVVVHDRLVSAEVLGLAPASARRISVGKAPDRHPVPQDEINEMLVALARQGQTVVRLKGGDPYIFGRGAEEIECLKAAGIPYELVPGITAAQGCSAATGVPLTHRGLATGVRYVTGHCRADLPLDLDWAGLADLETTLVVYMGAASIAEIASKLIAHGMPADLPVLAINNGTTPSERRLLTRLDDVAGLARDAAFSGPVLFIIGRVVSLYEECPGAVLVRIAADLSREVVHA